MEQEDQNGHFLRRWVSLGDVISLALSIAAIGVTYGQLSSDLRHTNETVEQAMAAVTELQQRDITPGARTQLAAIVATDQALQQQVTDIRNEMRDQRREVVEAIGRVEAKLDQHAERGR